MSGYRELLDYNKKYCEFYLNKYKRLHITHSDLRNSANKGPKNDFPPIKNIDESKTNDNISRSNSSVIPETIKELLNKFIGKEVIIVLNARRKQEKVKIKDIVDEILVSETEDREIKFIDINCICEVIIDDKILLKTILRP